VLLTKGANAPLEFIRCSLRRRDITQIVEERLGAVVARGVATLDFVVDLAPCQSTTRGHGRKALFARLGRLCLAPLAFGPRRRRGGSFPGRGDLGGARAQFPDRPRFGRLGARALSDALANASAQFDADKRVALVKS
jgi:hypothetical protein